MPSFLKKDIKKPLLPPLSKLPRLADGFGPKGLALQKLLLLIHPKKVGPPYPRSLPWEFSFLKGVL
jgi:hypothetical protein